jgi:hypothetical protein
MLQLIHRVSDFLTSEDRIWFMELLVQWMNGMARSIPNDSMSDLFTAWGCCIQRIVDITLRLADDATLEKSADTVMQIVRLLIDEVVNGSGVHCIDLWRPVLPFVKVLRQKLSIEFTLFPGLSILHFFHARRCTRIRLRVIFGAEDLNNELDQIRKGSRNRWEKDFGMQRRSFFAKV